MALLTFVSVLLLLLLVAIDRLLLAPLHFLTTLHLPVWISIVTTVSLIAWLIGE